MGRNTLRINMPVFLTSDLHLGHKAIAKHRPIFTTMEEHDEYVFSLLEKLTKRDMLFVLGDFLFDGDHFDTYMDRLGKLPARIKLIMGNHDSKRLYTEAPRNIELQLPLMTYKGLWLSHCPMHPQEMRNRKGNVHGHLHEEVVDDTKYFNVNLDVSDYYFVNLDTVKDYFKESK